MRLLALLLAATATLVSPSFAQVIAIRAGRVLDPTTGSALLNQVILVQRGRIGAIGPNVGIPPGATVYDLSHATIIPGLIDGHVHLVLGGPVRANALADLRAGFTTVVDLGSRTTRLLPIRDSINSGDIPGPRVFAAGVWVGRKNGVCEFGGIGIPGTPAAFRRRVRENIEAGADVIKLCVTGWPADAYKNPNAYEIPDSTLKAAVDEAHAGKRKVVAHDLSRGGVRAAVAAGIDGLAHAAYLDSATAMLVRTRSIFMIPTLASLAGTDTSAASQALMESVGLAQRLGVRLVFGTDAGAMAHGRNAQEFVALYQAGVPLAELLRMATINAARAYGLDSLGQLGAGMVADLVALETDPRDDVMAYQKVRFVMSRGQVVVSRP